MESTEFDGLILGLAEFVRRDGRYPYPELLSHALNKLALEVTAVPYPRTLTGLLALLEKPVKTWYPRRLLPKEFDSDFGLLYERGLSEEASRYFYEELLEQGKIPEFATAATKQIAIENYQFYKILARLQELYNKDSEPERVQQEYVLLRPFLIKNGYTTPAQLRKVFSKTRHIDIEEVGDLYEDCQENEPCWNCDRCGPLFKKYGKLRGIKPSACNDHRQDLPYVKKITWQQGLRRLKFGIHLRICLPGIPEIRLFHTLEELQRKYPDQLCDIRLYPGIDRYDLQLRFCDGATWAVDIKDYRSPYNLASKLTPLFGEGDLRYDEGFYVIPIQRLQQREDYLEILRQQATKLPSSTRLLSDAVFKERVINKIEQLQGKK
ncbi:restriction endonuclease-related protein [Nostoc sp.]|uniref:restriction endonuclease-related protein n=1 Tax=Nostoc sp. TaxID=1180 RepID=UPI002FF6EA0E